MDLNIVIKPNLTQRLTFTPFFNLSLKVLQLNHHDLTEHILASANENPLLEVEVTESDFGYSSYKTDQSQERFDESFSLTDYLIDQARLIQSSNYKLLEYCIYLIDERGYLNEDIKKVALENNVSESEVEAVVLEIQQLEPIGVGARDLNECLLIQAKKLYPDFKLLETIINHHLYDVAENNVTEIEKATVATSDEILKAIVTLKGLNPIPGNGFEFKKSEYIIPEFEVIKTAQDNLEVKLFYNWKINLNQDYKKQLNLVTSQEKELLNKYLNDGKQLINAVSKRQDSLQRIVTTIVKHQQAYLINNQPLKRLRLVD